jgi:hypothetical protein
MYIYIYLYIYINEYSYAEPNPEVLVDPGLIRTWNRKLGILYFGSDLPVNVQHVLTDGIIKIIQKKKCNQKIDFCVKENSEKILNRMDLKYKKLIDQIIAFLEAQENFYVSCAANVTDFYLALAKVIICVHIYIHVHIFM